MVSHLLGTEDIDRDLEELILEKTEGVPFFIEEFIRSLKDLQIIEREDSKYHLAKDIQEATIPSTIQDVIMARVDSLPESAKEILQTGSVIEREFSYELIKQVTALPEQELLSHLSALKDSELLYERGIYPEVTYIFKHALTQQVVYDSILTRKKRNLHEEIGNTIEELYKENIDEHYGVLAEHYITSETYEKGAEYSRLAGKKAQKAASFNDAIAYCEKGISSLEKLPATEDVQKKIIDARATLGLYYNQTNNFVLSKEAVEPIVELALERDYKRRIAHIYTIIGTYSWAVEEDFPEALKYLEEAIKIAKESNDLISLVMANHYTGHVLADNCEFERALYHLEKGLEINVAADNLWGIATHKSCIARTVYCFQGKIDLGYQASHEGLRLAEESGDILSKAEAYLSLGFSCYGKGFFDEAERHLLKAIDFCERLNLVALQVMARFCLGETYFYRREYQKSKDHYGKLIWLYEHNRLFPSWTNLIKLCLERAMVMNNEKDIDLESLYGYAAENKVRLLDGTTQRYIGEILLNIEDQDVTDAEVWIKKAIEADKRNGVMFELGKDYALYAELFKRKGDQSKAEENLNKAIEIFKECGADGWLEKAEEEMAALS